MNKFTFLNKDKIAQLPKTSGVYAFKKGARLLYIGKAANIKERVKQHQELLVFSTKVGYIKTDSEIEALILEANLIKKHRPKYNIAWKDDKNYFYVGITKEDFPQIFITHQTQNHAPHRNEVSGAGSKLLEAIPPRRRTSSLRGRSGCYWAGPSSRNKFHYRASKKKNYNLKLKTFYIGPFIDGSALKQTLKTLRKVFPYRTCKTLPKRLCLPKFLKKSLKTTKVMETQKLGRACLWYQLNRCPAPCLLIDRDRISIILTKKVKKECQENVKKLIKILQGKKIQILKNLKKEMKETSAGQEFERAAKIRDKITALEKVISQARVFESQIGIPQKWERTQRTLQKIIETEKQISRIEAYDVSNIQGKTAAGSLVTFINGFPDKNFYRRFKIKTGDKPNDVAMLKEVLSRRLKHHEWPYPDLILIDGGKPQLNIVKQQRARSGLAQIKVVALAKKENKLFIEGRKKPILLKKLPREIFNLILQLRDEAHRFAIAYHRKLRTDYLIPK